MKPTVLTFFVSSFFAFVGGHMINYSLIMYAQDVFGSDLLSGIAFGLCFGPPIILGWIAGVYSDRMPPGRITAVSQLVFSVAALLVIALEATTFLVPVRVGLFLGAAFLVGIGWSFIAPSRLAALAQIVGLGQLHRATIVFNLLIMIGFGLAPILIALARSSWGWVGVFWVITILFLSATLLLQMIQTKASTNGRATVLSQVKEGLQSAAAIPLVWQLLVCTALVYMVLGPMQVLLPRFASSVLLLDEVSRGFFLGILAVSLIIGGVLCMVVGARQHLGASILAGVVTGAVAVFSISVANTYLWAALSLAAAGMSGGYAVSLVVAGLQHSAPAPMRGRIMSIYTITSQVIPALTGLVAGGLSQWYGPALSLQLAAIAITSLGVLAAARLGAVRRYRTLDVYAVEAG